MNQSNLNYDILLAPFYFFLGNMITTYIEYNTDEMGNLKPVQIEESEEEYDDEEEGENEVSQDSAPQLVSKEAPKDDEPRIEEEKIDTTKP